MANPITVNLPADLPTNWVEGQTVAPEGSDAGLSEQHGYNYLMQQVNNAQKAANQLGTAFEGLDTKILVVPTQSGSVVYNGQAQSPTWNAFDTRRMTLGGTSSATNAGTYNATFAPKSGFTWSDGTTATKTVTWTIKKAVIPVLPSQADKLIYNGSAQSPTWLNYDSNKLTLGGTTSRTNAGSSNATFTPTSNYTWWDGTTSSKTVSWSVSKADLPTPTLSKYNMTLTTTQLTGTFTVNRLGDGTITVSSSDTSVVTVSKSGTTVTVTSPGTKKGTASISVTIAAGTNYNAYSGTLYCQVEANVPTVYGVSWAGTSSTALTRTDASAGFADPVPYVAGATTYGSPFDNLMPWADMVRVTDAEAGELVAIPKFWYKLTQNGNGVNIQIADGPVSGYSVCPACMDRGDGAGERDVVYIARYKSNANYKSESGHTPLSSISLADARNGAQSLGASIWAWDYACLFTVQLLYIVEFANFNSQSVIGFGCGSAVSAVGYTDSMPYHTGTTQANRNSYSQLGTQYRYIEGLWDNLTDYVDGIHYSSGEVKLRINPNTFSEWDAGISIGTPVVAYPTAVIVVISSFFPLFYGSSGSGSGSTYIPDTQDYRGNGTYNANMVVSGGRTGADSAYGLFYIYTWPSSGTAGGTASCRLMKLP